MDEDLEINEKFTKRIVREVCDYTVHFAICGESKGTSAMSSGVAWPKAQRNIVQKT